MRFALGEVVGCYVGTEHEVYGVVVRLPTEGYPRYRVRISTEDFSRFVEIGVGEQDLTSETPPRRESPREAREREILDLVRRRKA